jgi:hypothetical protein
MIFVTQQYIDQNVHYDSKDMAATNRDVALWALWPNSLFSKIFIS